MNVGLDCRLVVLNMPWRTDKCKVKLGSLGFESAAYFKF